MIIYQMMINQMRIYQLMIKLTAVHYNKFNFNFWFFWTSEQKNWAFQGIIRVLGIIYSPHMTTKLEPVMLYVRLMLTSGQYRFSRKTTFQIMDHILNSIVRKLRLDKNPIIVRLTSWHGGWKFAPRKNCHYNQFFIGQYWLLGGVLSIQSLSRVQSSQKKIVYDPLILCSVTVPKI